MDHCAVCGGELEKKRVTYTKEEGGHLVAIGGVPAEVCRTCGEEYFAPEVVDELHRIIEARAWTETLEVPYARLRASAG
ncbi:unnamed protein product [marine sediment metagenome]|uniref:YgiT-type zinc finger domain-containing protein n=1 Tax=marine sediment metagenome TaxID=412755 RepID=X0Z449_9ZZZZ